MLNKDYKDIIRIFIKYKVRFLAIGAYAMAVHGYPRATGDFDLWIQANEKNSQNTYKALRAFGTPLKDIHLNIFSKEGVVFQIGVAPRRIDIVTKIDGVEFDEAYLKRKKIRVDGIHIPFISIQDLIKNKVSTGREKDILDVKQLRKVRHE